MDAFKLRELVEDSYGLKVLDIEKIKNVYRIRTQKDEYCLKVIRYSLDHFLFILGAIKHLQRNGFERIPDIIRRTDGEDYLELEGCYSYLTPWVNARECNYDNPLDLEVSAVKLAELHEKSRGFQVLDNMRPRTGWFKWPVTFNTRSKEILDFKKRIENKNVKTEFDVSYLEIMDEELSRANMAIENLANSEYIEKMKREIEWKGFCHHDYAHHNVLIEKEGCVYIIDFDYCILDSHLHDLSSLLLRAMKNGKWDINTAGYILEAYNNVKPIENIDIPIMAAFMEFPQDYWQVGIQYYWEQQPWGEEFFIKKLKKTVEDREDKQEFLEKFRTFKLK